MAQTAAMAASQPAAAYAHAAAATFSNPSDSLMGTWGHPQVHEPTLLPQPFNTPTFAPGHASLHTVQATIRKFSPVYMQ